MNCKNCLLAGGFIAWVVCRTASAALVYPPLDPTQYYESLRVGSFNNPSYTFTGFGPGSFTAPCGPNSAQSCASVIFGSQPAMSLAASVTAYPNDPNLSGLSQVTTETAYFFEIHGPSGSTPIPLVLDTFDSFTFSVGSNPSYSVQGAAETRLDGVNSAGVATSTYAVSDMNHPPASTRLYTYALPNTQYDIALIINNLSVYNNGRFGIDSSITASALVDPVLSFAPGFDSTGFTMSFSDGVSNGGATSSAPEPATFAMLAGGLLALWGRRLPELLRRAGRQFSA
jgi:hypothetical protein